MQKITKCVILAAGFGTRFLPFTKSVPKEMLPIVDTPVVELLVEEAVNAGITDILFIVSKHKKALEDHFDRFNELEDLLIKKGKTAILHKLQKPTNMAKYTFVRQKEANGTADALLLAEDFTHGEPFLTLFGDDLILGDKSGAKQLVESFEKTGGITIALKQVHEREMKQYGMVEFTSEQNGLVQIERFLEKPKPEETQSRLGVIGKYVFTGNIFDAIRNADT